MDACHASRLIKPRRHLPHDELQLLLILMGLKKDWIIDFITELPLCMKRKSMYDSILIVVDRYTKYAKYIPVRKNLKATKLADVLVEDVFSNFGKPMLLTSDWGSLFTSNYWSHFCYHLSVWLNYLTAFYPQTNSQIERLNQTLEQYLCNYVNYQQDDYVFWLKLAEFTYNNSVHSSTGIALFIAIYGKELTWTNEIRDEKLKDVPSTRTRALNIAKVREKLETRLKKAQEAQAKYYNKKHTPRKFKAGKKVYLNSKNIKSMCLSKK